ncbi:retrovirus-related pol polyprotein from transposon TNT 1-94 [Tanacetum coccineum]
MLIETVKGFEQTKRCYLTEVIPIFKTLKEHFAGVQTALFKEVKVMEEIFDQMNDEVDQNTVDKQCAEIVKKNLLIENENLIANCLSNQLLYDVEKSRCLDLEAEMSRVHNESKHISKLEREYLNLQLKVSHLSRKFKKKTTRLNMKILVSNVKRRSCEPIMLTIVTSKKIFLNKKNVLKEHKEKSESALQGDCFESITDPRVLSLIEHTSSLLTQIEDLKGSIRRQFEVALESVETVREIVEEARVVKPLDNALNYASSGSKPRSNTKKNRILPAKTENKKKVEDHPRTNKSVWTKVNRVDSSISSKRVVINSNSESVCKTCNKCLNSASHEMCVVNILNSVNATPTVKIVLNKGKQIWKPKGKLSDNSLNKTKQVWKATGKLFANVGYQWRSTGKKVTLGKLNCGYQWRPTGKKFALGELCPCRHRSSIWYMESVVQKTYDGESFKAQNIVENFIVQSDSGMITSELSWVMEIIIGEHWQFCDSDLEVAFRKHFCFVRDINGADLLKGSRRTNLYTISIDDMMKSSPICLTSKASKPIMAVSIATSVTINDLARKDLVRGLPRLKFEKDHLCSACQLGKSKKFSHKPKSENTNMEVLHTLHMDLCGPMKVQSIKRKKYILVIVDDYSRFTWVKFLRSKDETPEFVINFLKQIQVMAYFIKNLFRELLNQVMSEYYEGDDVVERRNRTLVEAARTMMIFSKAPMFLWAEALATACYTHNRSLIHTRHNKTPYELVHDKKPDLTFLRVFGALCYPTNDSEDLGKFQAKADIGIFVGYAPSRKGYRIYNKRNRQLMETIHVTFDEMHQTVVPVRMSSGPEPVIMTPGQLKSGLAPTDKELEMLFQPMFDEYLEQSRVNEPVPSATEVNAQVVPPGTSFSTTIAQDAPSTSASSSTSDMHHPVRQ